MAETYFAMGAGRWQTWTIPHCERIAIKFPRCLYKNKFEIKVKPCVLNGMQTGIQAKVKVKAFKYDGSLSVSKQPGLHHAKDLRGASICLLVLLTDYWHI